MLPGPPPPPPPLLFCLHVIRNGNQMYRRLDPPLSAYVINGRPLMRSFELLWTQFVLNFWWSITTSAVVPPGDEALQTDHWTNQCNQWVYVSYIYTPWPDRYCEAARTLGHIDLLI